jgi:hypothetical protein
MCACTALHGEAVHGVLHEWQPSPLAGVWKEQEGRRTRATFKRIHHNASRSRDHRPFFSAPSSIALWRVARAEHSLIRSHVYFRHRVDCLPTRSASSSSRSSTRLCVDVHTRCTPSHAAYSVTSSKSGRHTDIKSVCADVWLQLKELEKLGPKMKGIGAHDAAWSCASSPR